MIGFDGKPATCINETCATDARARRAPRHPNREQFMEPFSLVYYLRFADRIKIGVTTDLTRRLASIPHDELLAFELGNRATERARHQQFAASRVPGHREWFHRTPDLDEHIRALSEGITDVPLEATRLVKRAILGLIHAN